MLSSSNPQVIDFDTLPKAAAAAAAAKPAESSRWWPFSLFSSAPAPRQQDDALANVVASPTDEVIAMRKRDDDFIDIQVRKLSYAEVASLKPSSNVLDEQQLERSVTDHELARATHSRHKFDKDALLDRPATDADLLDEDELYEPEKRIPKRLNKYNNRNRPSKHRG